MKKKLLVGCLLLLATSSTFAFRILKEEIHSSPGTTFHVDEISSSLSHVSKKKNMMAMLASGQTTTRVPARSGKVGLIGQVDGYHNISITNDSTTKEVYEYKVMLDCTDAHEYFSRFVELEPDEVYAIEQHSYVAVQIFEIGDYPIIAATTVASGMFNHISNGKNVYTVTN